MIKKIFYIAGGLFLLLLVIAIITPSSKQSTSETETTPPPVSTITTESHSSGETSTGIGKTRSFFINELPSVDFTKGKDIDGQPVYSGRDGTTIFQLIGPEEGLTQASITVGMEYGDQEKILNQGKLLGVFARTVNPLSTEWVTSSISKLVAAPGNKLSKSFRNVKTTLVLADMGEFGFITLAYEAI